MNVHPIESQHSAGETDYYPPLEHQYAAEAVVEFFTAIPEIEVVYLMCSTLFYDAFREFLQALFIARRTYPIAYDKWTQEQIVEILGLPELYQQLPRLFEIRNFESHEILDQANTLKDLLDEYASDSSQ